MLTQAISGGVAQVRGLKMIRQTVQWIVYFVTVAALICGLEIVTGLPAQTQASLPLGTHLWIALWCVFGTDGHRIRATFAQLPAAVHYLHYHHLRAGLARVGIEIFAHHHCRSSLGIQCRNHQQCAQYCRDRRNRLQLGER